LTAPSIASESAPALAEVFRDHFDALYRFCVRLGASGADAEDLVQEVFITAHRRMPSYDARAPMRPWLYGIAYNVFRDQKKRAYRHRENLPGDVDLEDRRSDPPQETALRAKGARDLVRAALLEIPERRRVVFVMHELDGLSIREVADALDLPVRTTYARIEKAREEFTRAVRRAQGKEAP
jgi:RNA polymerase sigma-70 factor, ECF subfamily